MADKVRSMRLNEDDLEQFKEFAKENGLNQQQAFNSLLNMVKLENAKEKLGDRAKSSIEENLEHLSELIFTKTHKTKA